MSHPIPHDEGPYLEDDSFEQQLVDEERRRWEERNRLVEWGKDFSLRVRQVVKTTREGWDKWL